MIFSQFYRSYFHFLIFFTLTLTLTHFLVER